jgi:hypothetical protein
MPTLWFIKDGRVSYAESGPGTPLGFDEAVAVFGNEQVRFIGREAPNLGPDRPGDRADNVMLEVDETEGTNALLPRPGFYWAVSITPEEVERRLRRERGIG